ncbi:hypothetical protein EDD86DRAFT_268421 [Gorgonomyces haynaldii]|nr:hypothetical protein EDD86DRAFT_268421 [Gorgonomyces haynaldii]
MDPVPDLVDAAPNAISWTAYHGVEHLNGRLQPPYTDNRSLTPPFQIWDLLIHMFETARRRYGNRNIKYILRMGVGAGGANRYNLCMRGRLDKDPDPDAFLGQIERCLTETTLSTFETSGCSWCLCSSLLRFSMKQLMSKRFGRQGVPVNVVLVSSEAHRFGPQLGPVLSTCSIPFEGLI